jgi:hypothetical protein
MDSDRDKVSEHAQDFLRTGKRESADEIGSALGIAGGLARGGLVGGLAGAFLTPIAEAAGHKVAQIAGIEKGDDE